MSRIITVPISTIGYSLNAGITNENGSEITHIHEIPLFQLFTIDEIRYYDYLNEEYIVEVTPDEIQCNYNQGFISQANQFQNFPNNSNETTVIYHQVSPWSIKPSPIPEIQSNSQMEPSQPYGPMPDPSFSNLSFQNQYQQESLPSQQQVPIDYGMNNPASLFDQVNNNFYSNDFL